MEDKNIMMACKVAEAVRAAGGRTYYVGGYVRDQILGRENKDIDIEVHGISVQTLNEILDSLGERLTMGANFGIMGLRHYELDIAMPRSEIATGRGHKDFDVFVNPFLGEEKAARRRDFTMNALMQDVLSGEILDFFGGQEDMKKQRIRHVDERTFGDDPLRVLRAAQFAARFQFSVAKDTTVLSSKMDLSALPGERIFGELEKALLKADKPSVFFEELKKMNQLSVWFPELEALIGVPQNPEYHPEGDVWTHTLLVLDAAAGLRSQAAEPLWFMIAALCHDFGKTVTTEEIDGMIHAYKHETKGIPVIKKFLKRITKEVKLIQYVENMTKLHMEPNQKIQQNSSIKSFAKMFDRSICPEDLLLLAKADHIGRAKTGEETAALQNEYAQTEQKLKELLALFKERMSRPYLMGRDLVEAGVKPDPVFTEALAYAHKLRLAGLSKEDQLRQTLAFVRQKQQQY